MKDFYYYPMILTPFDKGYTVTFPDFKGLEIEAKDLEKAVYKGKEELAHYIYELEDKDVLPVASKPQDIKVNETEFVLLADINMLLFTHTYKPKSKTRAITLPEGLDELARKSGVNVSLLTQEAIKKYLGIEED